MSGMHAGDMVFPFLSIVILFVQFILPILAVVLAGYFIIKTVKKYEQRANERLEIEKENILIQQKKMDEMNQRLIRIESILKDVE